MLSRAQNTFHHNPFLVCIYIFDQADVSRILFFLFIYKFEYSTSTNSAGPDGTPHIHTLDKRQSKTLILSGNADKIG